MFGNVYMFVSAVYIHLSRLMMMPIVDTIPYEREVKTKKNITEKREIKQNPRMNLPIEFAFFQSLETHSQGGTTPRIREYVRDNFETIDVSIPSHKIQLYSLFLQFLAR